MPIPFTQYLRPRGRKIIVSISRPPEIEAKAKLIQEKGLRFECEELTTGHVSFTIADPVKGEDVAIKLCRNGPDVPATVDKLIEEFKL